MSPFSQHLYDLRARKRLSQSELADMLGYEQSYISALELSIKGPPTDEFVERLISTIEVSREEESELRHAANASQRKLVIEPDAPDDIYWFLNDLREEVSHLSPVQVRMMREILSLRASLSEERITPYRRQKRFRKEEIKTGQT